MNQVERLNGTYIQEPVSKLSILDIARMIPRRNRSECRNPLSPFLEILMLLQEDRNLNSPVRDSNDVKFGLWIDQLLDGVVEDIVDMLLSASVA
jgi:hypothetical protein